MAQLDPRIEVIRERFGLDRSDFWELPQKKGTWVAKHSALEVAAVKAGIKFGLPQVIEANSGEGIAAVCVQGELDGRSIWSIGECSPKNNRNAYPYAMAEKRAIDRVVLKLIGIHGLVYSEDEMSGSEAMDREPALGAGRVKNPTPDLPQGNGNFETEKPRANSRETFERLMEGVRKAGNLGKVQLRKYWTAPEFDEDFATLPKDWRIELEEEKNAFLASYEKKPGGRTAVDPNDSLNQQYAETMGRPS